MTPDKLREMAAWIDADERTRGLPPESFHGFDDAAMLRAHAAALEEIVKLTEVAHKHGWNGVENSKILARFFDDALEEVRNLRLLLSDKNADISAMGASRVKAEAAHAAALEEIERLNAAWKAQQFHLEAEERESAHWQERAEKAERRAERLKGHAEAMAARIEWYAEEGWVNGDIPEARAYRADKEE